MSSANIKGYIFSIELTTAAIVHQFSPLFCSSLPACAASNDLLLHDSILISLDPW